MGTYICWLDELSEGKDLLSIAGGKGANLARLVSMGLPVPRGFVVTTEAYCAFVAANSLLGSPPEQMRERIVAGSIPPDMCARIVEAYSRLDAQAVAVRSSGTAEDLASASFAGQHDTFLDVRGEEALLEAVRACWASLWSPRAVEYRERQGWSDPEGSEGWQLALAVVVQEMVPAEWAGVVFTADPVSGRRDRIVLEAVKGLGEALVSGQATGASYTLDKADLRVLKAGAEDRSGSAVPGEALREVAGLAVRVEEAFGAPQDIEWAYAGGRCYLLQARPLTALPAEQKGAEAEPTERKRYSSMQRAFAPNAIDHVPVAFYPFDFSLFFRPLLTRMFGAMGSLGLRAPAPDELFVEIGEGVVQLVPPDIRPTPKALLLPFRLLSVLGADWNDWLDECRSTLVARATQIDGEDLEALSEEELWARVKELQALLLDLSARRFIYFPHGVLVSGVFSVVLRLAAGKRAASLKQALLSDVPCATTHANQDLDRLAKRARSSEELRKLFMEENPAQLPSRLSASEEGRALMGEVNAYLQRYGRREIAMPAAALPALRDDPQVVYGLLKGLVGSGGPDGPARREAATDADASPRAAAARRRLWTTAWRRFPPARRLLLPRLLRLLDLARDFIAFREDSHFDLFSTFPVIRRLALEIGRRMVERGALEHADDIFYLQMDELLEPNSGEEMKDKVTRRRKARAAIEGRYTVVPAELLEENGGSGDLRGAGVSPGRAVGPVLIIRDERDFWKLQKGEVLVAPYTNPTWTPLFAVACAVVVDAGGTASHAAIVAREYQIPGVMGAARATSRLHDGQRVLVDGTKGTVVILKDVRSDK